MKNFIILVFLMSLGTPVLSDIVNPHLTPEQREEIRKARLNNYKNYQRKKYILETCGYSHINEITTKTDLNSCKAQLEKEHEETLKIINKYEKRLQFVDEYMKEKEINNDKKSIKNAINE